MSGQPVLLIHGGAGVGPRARMTPEREAAIRASLTHILAEGEKALTAGAPALDIVSLAVRRMEDDPLFNAGRGGAMTSEGRVEHDAAIMCGITRKAGATTGTRRVRHPVLLARAVMERTPHVMLSGEGAEALAQEAGLAFCEESWFHTPERRAALERIRQAAAGEALAITEQDRHGTVGAVALDRDGHVAAATSTGGRANKLPGRVGDSPLIGAGTYADDATAAISCTGAGEQFMRVVLAHRIAMRMELLGEPLAVATGEALANLKLIGGSGGLVAVSRDGAVASPFTGDGMHRGLVRAGSAPHVAIFAGEGFPADPAFA